MRKWTQFIKQQLSESVKKQIEEVVAKEINDSNPSIKDSFKGTFNESQKQDIERRFEASFDIAVQKTYTEVINKA